MNPFFFYYVILGVFVGRGEEIKDKISRGIFAKERIQGTGLHGPGIKARGSRFYMAKNQFMHPLGVPKKHHPAGQPGAAEPLDERIRLAPASQGLADPTPRSSSGTPHLPAEQPYLQVSQSLPGIPVLPGMQKKGQLTDPSSPQAYPGKSRGRTEGGNEPGQVSKWAPPGPSSSIKPAGNVPGPTNREIFSPFSTYLRGNFSGPHARQSGTGNLSPGSVPHHSPAGNSQYLAGKSLDDASNFTVAGGPTASYSGDSFPGIQRVLQSGDPLAPPEPGPDRGRRDSALRLSYPPKKNRRRPLPIWARIAIGLLVFLVTVTGGVFAYYEIEIVPSLNNILGKQAVHRTDGQTNNQGTTPTGRTNILLLGSDTDGKGNDPNNGVPLAQTVMIITVDPRTNYVGMLSIPRDMQVTESGYLRPKLDEVFSNGYSGHNLQDKVAAGAGEMEDIIQYNFGIHIDYYAWVGLDGFVKVINTAGGIDVDTIHPMVDDSYPDDVGNATGSIYDSKRLYIAPGPQHLDGVQALEYVRTRHSDLIGDFGRTIRQQQIINQLKIKLATSDSIGKASELLQDLNGAVQTDMRLNDVIGLGNLARGIDSNRVQRLTLGPPDYAVPNTYGVRQSNYLPRCENIVPAIRRMFNIASPNCVPQYASNSSSIASAPPSTTPTVFNTATAAESKPGSHDVLKDNTATNRESTSLYAGVHGLLGLLFTTTFESFDAMQI
jgi:LCP family protein required for cell wall assembly